MPSPRRSIQWLVLVALALAGCRRSAPVPDGDIVATLTVPSADDSRPFDPASLRGKPSLVVFASPTCGYCAKEVPAAQKIAANQGANVVVVYISGGKQHATSVAKSLGYTGPVLVDDGTLKKRYNIRGVPYTLVLGADGHARDAFRGLQDDDTLADALADAR